MKTTRLFLGAMLGVATAVVVSATDAKPGVRAEVAFIQPEKFTDVRDAYAPSEMGRNAILDQLRDYLVRQAQYYVPEGQKLTINFTDIDLAGDFEPWRGPDATDVRIIKDIYAPRMDFEFKLTGADGKTLKEGKRQLHDLAFMMKIGINRNDALHYDKSLLDDWLRNEFPRVKGS